MPVGHILYYTKIKYEQVALPVGHILLPDHKLDNPKGG